MALPVGPGPVSRPGPAPAAGPSVAQTAALIASQKVPPAPPQTPAPAEGTLAWYLRQCAQIGASPTAMPAFVSAVNSTPALAAEVRAKLATLTDDICQRDWVSKRDRELLNAVINGSG